MPGRFIDRNPRRQGNTTCKRRREEEAVVIVRIRETAGDIEEGQWLRGIRILKDLEGCDGEEARVYLGCIVGAVDSDCDGRSRARVRLAAAVVDGIVENNGFAVAGREVIEQIGIE